MATGTGVLGATFALTLVAACGDVRGSPVPADYYASEPQGPNEPEEPDKPDEPDKPERPGDPVLPGACPLYSPYGCFDRCEGDDCVCVCADAAFCMGEKRPYSDCESCLWDDDCPSGTQCYGAICDGIRSAAGKCRAPPPPPPQILGTYACWDTRDCAQGICCNSELYECGDPSEDVLGFCREPR